MATGTPPWAIPSRSCAAWSDWGSGQQVNASAATRARLRNELGADFILVGEITSIEDIEGNREVIYYQIDLNLTDLESNERVWIGQHRIKKFVERSRTRR